MSALPLLKNDAVGVEDHRAGSFVLPCWSGVVRIVPSILFRFPEIAFHGQDGNAHSSHAYETLNGDAVLYSQTNQSLKRTENVTRFLRLEP